MHVARGDKWNSWNMSKPSASLAYQHSGLSRSEARLAIQTTVLKHKKWEGTTSLYQGAQYVASGCIQTMHQDCDSLCHPCLWRNWPTVNNNHVIETYVHKTVVKTVCQIAKNRLTSRGSATRSPFSGAWLFSGHQVHCPWTLARDFHHPGFLTLPADLWKTRMWPFVLYNLGTPILH